MKRGLTLIEILIVITIIVVLAAIAFPVFARAKDAAKNTACISNLHQLGQAHNLYFQDSNEYPVMFFADQSPMDPYVKEEAIWKCPRDPYSPAANTQSTTYMERPVSYFTVLSVEPRFLRELAEKDPNHGVFVCLIHGESHGRLSTPPTPLSTFKGLVHMVRKDASVQKRRPKERCFTDIEGRGYQSRTWWDAFTDEEPSAEVIADITGGLIERPCN